MGDKIRSKNDMYNGHFETKNNMAAPSELMQLKEGFRPSFNFISKVSFTLDMIYNFICGPMYIYIYMIIIYYRIS